MLYYPPSWPGPPAGRARLGTRDEGTRGQGDGGDGGDEGARDDDGWAWDFGTWDQGRRLPSRQGPHLGVLRSTFPKRNGAAPPSPPRQVTFCSPRAMRLHTHHSSCQSKAKATMYFMYNTAHTPWSMRSRVPDLIVDSGNLSQLAFRLPSSLSITRAGQTPLPADEVLPLRLFHVQPASIHFSHAHAPPPPVAARNTT